MARELLVSIDDELDKEMSKYPGVDWSDAVRELLRACICRKEIAEMYTEAVEKVFRDRNNKPQNWK